MLLALLTTIPGASPALIAAVPEHVLLGLEPLAEVQRRLKETSKTNDT